MSYEINILNKLVLVFLSFLFSSCSSPIENVENNHLIILESSPQISQQAIDLIVNFEVTSKNYYIGHYQRPTYPGESSGVTIGIGVDLAFEDSDIIRQDWQRIQEPYISKLADSSGMRGNVAKNRVKQIQDVLVSWDIANEEFKNIELTRYYQECIRAFPGCENLRLNAFGGLISLGFNRGFSMAGPSRKEMREIRDLVPLKDYVGIAAQIRQMKRLWRGTSIEDGMNNRRDAEAELVLTP